jgi:hypothetical protein
MHSAVALFFRASGSLQMKKASGFRGPPEINSTVGLVIDHAIYLLILAESTKTRAGPVCEIGLGNSWTWKWSHVLRVVSCHIVLLASNHLTDNTSQHATTGINIRAE